MAINTRRNPMQVSEVELAQLRELAHAIKEHEDSEQPPAILVNDVQIEITPTILEMLREATEVLLEGDMVAIVPIHQELTTQEAADYLNVSRPYLVKILEEGAIPFHMVGTHRRVRFSDLEEYEERESIRRRALLDEMTREAQKLGLYDVDIPATVER